MTETTQQSTTYPHPVYSAATARQELASALDDLADTLSRQAKAVASLANHAEEGVSPLPVEGAPFTAAEIVAWLAEVVAKVGETDLAWFVRKAAEHDDAARRATEANWLISRTERDYVSAVNATLAAPPDNREDYHRWTGMCQAYAEVDRAVRERHSFPEHMLRNRGWRSINGVYSDAEVAQMHKGDGLPRA
jgi:hypothetical protein